MTTTTQPTPLAGSWPRLRDTKTKGNIGQWQERHDAAATTPRTAHERAIVHLCHGLTLYGQASELEWNIADDGVLGPPYLQIAKSVCALLDGEIGRLDGGTVWTFLDNTLRCAGYEKGLETE